MSDFSGKVAFAIGTGRCGTQFLSKVLHHERGVASTHERNPLNESFHRYCQWYRLPVDHEGFLQTKEREIQKDLQTHQFSFEASAFLSLSVQELFERFDARFISMVRRPDQVVNSFWSKNWYAETAVWQDKIKAPGYQDLAKEHHFFSRLLPRAGEFAQWEGMSRVGKLAWFWNTVNLEILAQLQKLPQEQWRIFKLEELNYQTYQTLRDFLGIKPGLSEGSYKAMTQERPNRRRHILTVADWSDDQIADFESQVKPAAEQLGYEYQVHHLSPVSEQTTQKHILLRPKKMLQIIGKKLVPQAITKDSAKYG
ncbi:MAG: hypothetical protein KJ069_09375 [Anaerolineae bacterium]|nr:hypothetical protein [Anaerolineae bacterium]